MTLVRNFFKSLFLIVLLLISCVTRSQENSTYNLEFVRAIQYKTNSQNHILTIFKVTPTVKDFKMILSMRVSYEIGKGREVINVLKQREDNIKITIYGKDVSEKSTKIYNLIKNRLNLDTKEDIRLIVFDFHDITKVQIDTMTVIYGLWESDNENVRKEKTFTFKVENSEW